MALNNLGRIGSGVLGYWRGPAVFATTVRSYETLSVTIPADKVKLVELHRPEKMNAMNSVLVKEIGQCFQELNDDATCRTIVLTGSGKLFTAGLDFADMGMLIDIFKSEEDIARKFKKLLPFIKQFQDSMSSLEKCCKPVIAAIHNGCIGAGVDLCSAADIRYCTSDAWFQVKEVDIGLAADVGTLQRLPKIVGSESLVRELAFSARKMHSDEAKTCGLVNRVFPDKSSMLDGAIQMASLISSKSPVAVQGTKVHLTYSRDHTVDEALHHQAVWNAALLQSEDVMKSAMAQIDKSTPKFNDF